MTAGRPNACPHCGASPCLPLWRKLTLGPAAKVRCPSCGFRVTVAPLQAWATMAPPWIILILAAFQLVAIGPALLLFIAAFVLCLLAYASWVPLARWDISNPSAVARGIARTRSQRPH